MLNRSLNLAPIQKPIYQNMQRLLCSLFVSYRHRFFLFLFLPLVVLYNASCVDPQKLVYFPNQVDTVFTNLAKPPEAIIKENDVLGITVSSLNPTASGIFNAPNAQATGSNGTLGVQTGYLVSPSGFITFPILGQVKATGITTAQLSTQLSQAIIAQKLLLDPIVTVRQLNYHITLIGEMGRPGVYTIANEKINLLEALGQAGELTPYANRKNVVLIRDEGGKRTFRRIDLNSSNILTSPDYYLKSGDIVYAESNKVRATAVSNQGQIIGYSITAFSILLTLVTFIISVNR